jgi:CRISPR-associated endonuclease/helicase Cas3
MEDTGPKAPAAHTPREGSEEWHDLEEHLLEVAKLAEVFAEKFGASTLAHISGRWHDLGKFNPAFQEYLRAAHRGIKLPKVPHAIYGAAKAASYEGFLEPLAFLIAGHHAGMPAQGELVSRIQKPQVQKGFERFCELAKSAGLDLEPPSELEQQLDALPQEPWGAELLLRFIFSSLVDADFIDTERHFDPEQSRLRQQMTVEEMETETHVEQLRTLWGKLKRHQGEREAKPGKVNDVRAEVLSACISSGTEYAPGLFRLLVPTGGGKTLSGLAFALQHAIRYGLERVIFAVPYTSIIEQTVSVYRGIFGEEAVLEHHSASRDDAFDGLEEAEQAKIRARLATQNWDAPLIVTTTVQLFESLFHNRPSKCRKLHSLSKAVIVLDEVQTLPVSLLQPIVSVLGELASERYGSSIVLCTATQPALEVETQFFKGFGAGRVRDIVPLERAKTHFRRLERVIYEPRLEPVSWANLAAEIAGLPQYLVVVNTRKDALKLLDELEKLRVEALFHLSTLLCGKHRREVLAEVTARLDPKNPQPVRLISTQVVEAGVDLDFPTVYRAMGPLERIVQAAGRCNREWRDENHLGKVVIFVPEGGGSVGGDYETALSEAADQLRKGVDFSDPSIFESYYTRLYQGIPTDKHGVQPLRASFNFPEVAARFKLINDDTTPVVIRYDDKAEALLDRIRHRGFLLAKEHRALQPLVVNLRSREVAEASTLTEDIMGVKVWHGSYDRELRGINVSGWSVEDLMV